MPQEYIEIHGARENNLKNVSLRIPKRKITIFTGVSGSGKSSIVFDTIATESQRLLNENFSMFVRNFLPKYSQPEADSIENLSMSIVVDQKRMGGGSHSTVGTITDINTILRMMFSRIGQPHVGPTNVFGFNDPQGMCPNCNGLGRKLDVDMEKFLDKTKSLNEGAIFGEMSIIGQGMYDTFAEAAEECVLCVMSRADLERLVMEKPLVALRLVESLGRRVRELESQVEDIAFKSVRARLAARLLRLRDEAGSDEITRYTHQDLADMVGTYRETATQVLNELRAEEIINIGRKKITILDMERLKQIAEE